MWLFISLAAVGTLPAAAQEAPAGEIEEMRQRLRATEMAIDELRGTAEASTAEIPLDLQMRLRGYTAVNLNYLEEWSVLGFSLDETIFQYQANLDRFIALNTEVSFEPGEHGVEVGLEWAEILVRPTPAFQMSAGAFHLPTSPWAITASQGAYRYLPTAIPEALEEAEAEEFLPIDQLGLQFRGQVPIGFWQFTYAAAATNGRAPDPGVPAHQLDFNNPKALIGRVGIASPGGLQVGAGAYYDIMDVHDESLIDGTEDEDESLEKRTIIDDASETILSGYVNTQGGALEISSEVHATIHGYEGESWTSLTAFAIVGVPVDKTTPYFMVDYVNVDPADPIYAVFNQTGPELELFPGFRYELGIHVAFKSQVEIAYELDSESWGWGVQAQLAAGF